MDTAAYLKKQGWRGIGHSLDHSDRGIKKPLQISKKVDALGVGIQKYAAVSDQWWLRAYDQGLKDFGTGKESALSTAQKHGINRGGLYARFVKGEEIPGTIGQRTRSTQSPPVDTKRLPSTTNDGTAILVQQKSGRDKKSLDLKRKQTHEQASTLQKRTKKLESDGSEAARNDTSNSSEQPMKIKKQIRAYIDEATRRGLLPADAGAAITTAAPTEQDMAAVLRLAKLHKPQRKPPQLLERAKLVRNLKRAVCRHLESQLQTAPA